MMKTRADLMEASRGYWPSRTLLTAVEIGLFEALGRRRRRAASVARALGTDPRATRMLLDALAALGVLSKREGGYALRREMAPLLTEGEDSCLGMLRHHARLWAAWDRLTDCVRRGDAVARHSGFRGSPEDAAAFTRAMRDGARRLAPLVAEEVSWRGRRRLLDLGGGPGVYAAAFARLNPRLQVVVVDLPAVCEAGRATVGREAPDVMDRIAYHASDLDAGALPPGADAAFLSHVIHGQSPAEARSLLRRIRRALPAGGVLVVRDFFTSADGTKPPGAALFALNMLVNTPAGDTYARGEVTAWLRQAGFASVSWKRSASVPDTGYLKARVARR